MVDLSCEFSLFALVTSFFSKANCCCSSILVVVVVDAGSVAVSEDMTGEVALEPEEGCEVGRFAMTQVGVISDFIADVGLG